MEPLPIFVPFYSLEFRPPVCHTLTTSQVAANSVARAAHRFTPGSEMGNEEHRAILRRGVEQWNAWRQAHREIRPDLSQEDLSRVDLSLVDLSGVILSQADVRGADLRQANLSGALLISARMSRANLSGALLGWAHLRGANLYGADLLGVDLREADLREADLRDANLRDANLRGADLSQANLSGADLTRASLIGASFPNATLDRCSVYGISAWDVRLDGTIQTNLRITPSAEPEITVDNLEVAQFLYLLLHNDKIRQVVDTVTGKVVLILGRFSHERKPLLEALRDALRQRGYVPVLFDFSGPESKNTTETVVLLARMARFVIADLTDPGSIPYELAKIVPDAHVPVQPLLLAGTTTFAMAGDLWMAREMLPVYRYTTTRELLADLPERVIEPAEAKVKEIQFMRATAIMRSGLP